MDNYKFSGALVCLTSSLFLTQPALAQTQIETSQQANSVEDILITATRLPRKSEDIAGTVTLISDTEIQQSIHNDIADVIRYQPGVSMNSSARGGNQGYSIRGIGGNRVLTLIDGIRSNDIYAAGPSSYGKDAFEIDDLKAIEIIRGPASVLYGADAMGGAVLLRTKDASDYLDDSQTRYFGLNSSASGADDQYKLGLTGAFQSGDIGTVVRLTRREYSELETNSDFERNPQDGEVNNLFVKSQWALNDLHSVQLAFDLNSETVEYNLLTDLSDSVTESFGSDETDRSRFSAQHLWQANTLLADSIESQLYWQQSEALQHTEQLRTSFSFINPMDVTTYAGTEAQRITDFEFNQQTQGLGSTFSKSFDSAAISHSMVYGFNYEQTDTERPRNRCETATGSGAFTCDIAAYPFAPVESFPNKTFPDTKTIRTGIYWQNEMIIGASGLNIIPGIRYDDYQMQVSNQGLQDLSFLGYEVSDSDEQQVSINFGAIYDLTDTTSLFVQYAEGFRPPSFDEANQAFVNLGFGYASLPNADLLPETSEGIEFGIKSNFERISLNLALYDNDYENFIDRTFVGTEGALSLFQERNIEEVSIRGVEIDGDYLINQNWRLRGSIAYAKGDNTSDNAPLDSIEPLTGVFGIAYNQDNRWGIETLVTLVDGKDRVSANDLVTADAYGLVDLIGYYHLSPRSSLRLGVFNLTDEKYARWANIQGLSADATEDIARSMETGTNVRASISLNF